MFRQSVFAVVCASGVLSAVGCLNTNRQKDPIPLSADARGQLRGPGEGVPRGENSLPPPQLASAAKPVKPAAYDPTATGGTGVTKENSFARTTPNNGGVIPPVKLPAPEIGGTGPFTPPVVAGASYGDPLPDTGIRTAGVRGSAPIPPLPPPSSAGNPMSSPPVPTPKLPSPKLGPPEMEPPVQLTGGGAPIPVSPAPLAPVPSPTTKDVPLPAPMLPIEPVAPPPAPGVSSSPVPPSVIKSPVDEPIPGLPPIKLPPAQPIRPQ